MRENGKGLNTAGGDARRDRPHAGTAGRLPLGARIAHKRDGCKGLDGILVRIGQRLPDPADAAVRSGSAGEAGAVALVARSTGLLDLQEEAVAVAVDAQVADMLDIAGGGAFDPEFLAA